MLDKSNEVCEICGKSTEIERKKGNNNVIICYCPLCKRSWFENENR